MRQPTATPAIINMMKSVIVSQVNHTWWMMRPGQPFAHPGAKKNPKVPRASTPSTGKHGEIA